MIVSGFVEPITKELPLEYAVEMNRLIQLQMEGSVGDRRRRLHSVRHDMRARARYGGAAACLTQPRRPGGSAPILQSRASTRGALRSAACPRRRRGHGFRDPRNVRMLPRPLRRSAGVGLTVEREPAIHDARPRLAGRSEGVQRFEPLVTRGRPARSSSATRSSAGTRSSPPTTPRCGSTACSSTCRRASCSRSRSTCASRTRLPEGSLFWRLLVVAEEGSQLHADRGVRLGRARTSHAYSNAVAELFVEQAREARVRLDPEPLARDVALRHAPRARRARRASSTGSPAASARRRGRSGSRTTSTAPARPRASPARTSPTATSTSTTTPSRSTSRRRPSRTSRSRARCARRRARSGAG